MILSKYCSLFRPTLLRNNLCGIKCLLLIAQVFKFYKCDPSVTTTRVTIWTFPLIQKLHFLLLVTEDLTCPFQHFIQVESFLYVAICLSFITQHDAFWASFMHISVIHSSSLLGSILLSDNTTICICIYLLWDIGLFLVWGYHKTSFIKESPSFYFPWLNTSAWLFWVMWVCSLPRAAAQRMP